MRDLSKALLLSAALFTVQRAAAQDSLSNRDVADIRYKAERIVRTDLSELLNSLSNTGFEPPEVAESIHSSYSESRSRIFRDSLVVVEPDLNPTFQNSAQSGDAFLDKYLKDIDILYKKSDSATITFSNIRCSSVKKKGVIYVKVYYNCMFKGKSTVIDQPYTVTNRIAEIQAEKDKNQWRLLIVRLGFFSPADTTDDVTNNIPVKYDMILTGLTAQSTAKDSADAIQKQISFEEQEQNRIARQLEDQDKANDDKFNKLMSLGTIAFRQKDFTVAMQHYKDAQEIRPNSPEVNLAMKNTSNAMTQFKYESAKLYQDFLDKAVRQTNNRQYKEAIESYQEAIKQKPEESANLEPRIRELTDKFAILSDLQEKYNAGYVKEALKEYTDAIKKDPKNSDYYLGRGRCHEKLTDESKNTALALKDYTQAYELDRLNLAAVHYRAELYARTGDYFKALSDYKICLTLEKENMEFYEKKSEMHVLLNLPADAISDLDEAIKINPKASHVYLVKGMLQYDQKDITRASDNFTTCLRIDSSNALAWFGRGRCDILLNKILPAAMDFASAREKGLDSNNCRIVAGYAQKYYERAVERFNNSKTDSAVVYIDYSISIDPTSALYRFTRGDYYYSLAKYNEAIGSYDRAVLYNPSYMQAFYKRGMARYGIADHKEAIVNFESALKLDPQNLLAEKGEGDAYQALKDYANAAVAYENALRISANSKPPTSPTLLAEVYNALGHCYFEQGDYEKAVSNGKKAISNNRNFAEAYFNRGYAYYKQGQLSDAIDDVSKAISFDDSHLQWHYVLGRAYQEKKDLGNAVAQFAACAQKDAALSIPDAIYKQGYCHYMMQNYTAALPFYSRSLSLHLDTAQPAFNIEMGIVYLNTGKYDSAYLFCQMAFQRDSTNGYASYGIGSSLALQGKADESMAWFERSFQKKTPSYGEIKRDKLLADMRNNKKFKELLKKYF
jgi:tetratricopeptide (TPR) repeat protein